MLKILKRLGQNYSYQNIKNHVIDFITDDSRLVSSNSIFVAKKVEYINDAIAKGAKTIIVNSNINLESKVNVIIVIDLDLFLSESLKILYKKKFKHLKLVGITGTNGKSSVAFILYELLNKCKVKCLLIGTHIVKYNSVNVKTNNTTLSLSEIYYYLKQSKIKKGFLIMEVSSQGIATGRVKGLLFDYLIFTSITSDHLDYHITIDNYVNTKLSLLKQLKKDGTIILNRECNYYKDILLIIDNTNNVFSYGFTDSKVKKQDYQISMISDKKFKITHFKEDEIFFYHTIGFNNLRNLSIAYIFSQTLSLKKNIVSYFINNFEYVDGRLEKINVGKQIIIIDYAHTSSAVLDLIQEVKSHYQKDVCVVIGCGGNRDKTKRPIIGDTLLKFADRRIITTDNNRCEKFSDIACDIVRNNKNDFVIIENRMTAIFYALTTVGENEIILILGKGTEKNGPESFYMTDKEIVKCWEEKHALSNNRFN